MAQKLYTAKIFYRDEKKHFSVWHNCNCNGVRKIQIFGVKRGIAYAQFFKQHSTNSRPLFTIFIEDVFAISVFFSDGRGLEKKYNIIDLNTILIFYKSVDATGVNVFNMKENKFVETIKF